MAIKGHAPRTSEQRKWYAAGLRRALALSHRDGCYLPHGSDLAKSVRREIRVFERNKGEVRQERRRRALETIGNIANFTRIPVETLTGNVQSPRDPVVHTRQVTMMALRDGLDMSLPEIGQIFGRDHTTALYGIHRAGILVSTQQRWADMYSSFKSMIPDQS